MAITKGRSGERLSSASPYEQRFETRHRRVGRPSGSESSASLFAVGAGVHPLLAAVAKRRAHAVLLEEHRERLGELFGAELKVLKRRGVQQVASDVGVDLGESVSEEDISSSSPESGGRS